MLASNIDFVIIVQSMYLNLKNTCELTRVKETNYSSHIIILSLTSINKMQPQK